MPWGRSGDDEGQRDRIPAQTIHWFVMEKKVPTKLRLAMKKKEPLSGPFSFVRGAYSAFQTAAHVQEPSVESEWREAGVGEDAKVVVRWNVLGRVHVGDVVHAESRREM